MTQKATGGPAFPTKEATTGDVLGLSIRDYFAAHAPVMPASFDRKGTKVEKIVDAGGGQKKFAAVTDWESSAQHAARWAFEYADAMIALRGGQ